MIVQVIGAGVLAFAVTAGIGEKLVPWLKEHGFAQPIKEEVKDRVYSQEKSDKADSAGDK